MELVYIYIDKFKNLENQDINFGGEYRFAFDAQRLKLDIKRNELYIKGFYNINQGKAQVLNVSSIIGENGTGKSSILQFIKDNLCRGKYLEYPAIIVIKVENQFKILTTYAGLAVDESQFVVEFIDNPTKGDDIFNFGYDLRGFSLTDIIFFSNIFDGTPGGSVSGLLDISTNSLVFEDYNTNLLQKIINKDEGQMSVFLTADIFRQLILITSDIPRDVFPFRLPETLIIAVYEIINTFGKDSDEFSEFEKMKMAIKEHYTAEYLRNDEYGIVEDSSNKHVNYLIAAVLESLVRELLQIQSKGKDLGFTFKFSGDFIIREETMVQYISFEDRINYFFNQVRIQVSKQKENFEQMNELIVNSKNFIDFVMRNKSAFYNNALDHRNPVALINIYDGPVSNEALLREFMNLYRKTFSINHFLKFSWRNLSTGENALLNIYSRFYSLSDSVKVGKLEKHLIILIDEGDTYLHPAWQKKLLINLLEFLPIVYSRDDRGQRTIQIILTTNSAIPASDFLSYNTIFLQKVSDGNNGFKTIIRDSLNEQKATFAANIHTLLSDSFFIDNGLRGDFANYKINEVLKYLKGQDHGDTDEEDILKLIDQIGEPLIKNSLRELYFTRFPHKISEEIKRLTLLQNKYGIN